MKISTLMLNNKQKIPLMLLLLCDRTECFIYAFILEMKFGIQLTKEEQQQEQHQQQQKKNNFCVLRSFNSKIYWH